LIPKNQRPKYVYVSKGRYVYKPYLGVENGKTLFGKEVPLGKVEDTNFLTLLKNYERVTSKDRGTLRWMLEQYHDSPQYKNELKQTTRNGYEIYFKTITTFPTASGAPWGDTPLHATTPKSIRKYLDKREAKTGGNREIQYLSAVFSWAYQRLDEVSTNPCLGVDLNEEVPDDRYVEDWEYAVVYAVALQSRARYAAPMMEFAYLGRARPHEVRKYKNNDVRKIGLLLDRGKGSRSEYTMWTPRLRAAVDACSSLYDGVTSEYLIHASDGLAVKKNAFDSLWQRLIKVAMKRGAYIDKELQEEAEEQGARIDEDGRVYLGEKFTCHSLKAKGISNHQDKEGGHRSEKMKRVYDRVPGQVKATR
jgi:hypothetical protein